MTDSGIANNSASEPTAAQKLFGETAPELQKKPDTSNWSEAERLFPHMKAENDAKRVNDERQAQERADEEQRQHTEAHEAALEGLSETQATFVQSLNLSSNDLAYVDRQLEGIEEGSLDAHQMYEQLKGLAIKKDVTFEQFEEWLNADIEEQGDAEDPYTPEAISAEVKQMSVEELDTFVELGNLYNEVLSSGDEAKMVGFAKVVTPMAEKMQVTPDRAMDILFGPEE